MRVAIISSNLQPALARLQPYRTLLEMGRELEMRGHDVVFISDGASRLPAQHEMSGMTVHRCASVHAFRGRQNPDLLEAVTAISPDLVLWHLGLGSFAHQRLTRILSLPTIAIVTSPAHPLKDILRSAPRVIGSNADLVATHLLGGLVPDTLIRNAFGADALDGVVTLSEATRQHLIKRGAPADRIWVVPPGIDQDWLEASFDADDRASMRRKLGFSDDDFVVTYFGSPAPVRGLFTLIKAVEEVAEAHPHVKMLVLSRRTPDRWEREAARLDKVAFSNGNASRIRVVDGYLDRPDLIRHIAAGDAVCLPFELLPSDVPLSILEAMAVEQAVIATRVACIPELVEDGRGFLVKAGSVKSIADRLHEIVADPHTTKAHQQRARAYVETCRKWTHMGEILEQVMVGAQHV